MTDPTERRWRDIRATVEAISAGFYTLIQQRAQLPPEFMRPIDRAYDILADVYPTIVDEVAKEERRERKRVSEAYRAAGIPQPPLKYEPRPPLPPQLLAALDDFKTKEPDILLEVKRKAQRRK
jgi:hypothetical protein